MDASVIIATHNRKLRVLRAVHALLNQDYPPYNYEIVVCCDRCTDGTLEALQAIRDERFRVVHSLSSGKTAALNAGRQQARGMIAIFIDDDVEPADGFVRAHILAHRSEKARRIVVLGYSPASIDSNALPIVLNIALNHDRHYEELKQTQRKSTPLDLAGCNFSIKAADLDEMNGFNENYFFQRDDFELATRLLEQGYEFKFCMAAEAPNRIVIDADTLIGRTTTRAQADYRLAREHPWCVPYLPFYGALSNPRSRRRWRLLWMVCRPTAGALGLARRLSPPWMRLINLEYIARYCLALKRETGNWQTFCRLGEHERAGIQ